MEKFHGEIKSLITGFLRQNLVCDKSSDSSQSDYDERHSEKLNLREQNHLRYIFTTHLVTIHYTYKTESMLLQQTCKNIVAGANQTISFCYKQLIFRTLSSQHIFTDAPANSVFRKPCTIRHGTIRLRYIKNWTVLASMRSVSADRA